MSTYNRKPHFIFLRKNYLSNCTTKLVQKTFLHRDAKYDKNTVYFGYKTFITNSCTKYFYYISTSLACLTTVCVTSGSTPTINDRLTKLIYTVRSPSRLSPFWGRYRLELCYGIVYDVARETGSNIVPQKFSVSTIRYNTEPVSLATSKCGLITRSERTLALSAFTFD